MLIRPVVPEDIPQIMAMAEQSETAAHWRIREYEALFAPEAPERIALVATQGRIAGFVIVRCGPDEWEIENVVVEAGVRRQGIGQSLLQDVLRRARSRGVSRILLEVRESNAAARALYAGLASKEEGRRKGYYQNPEEDAILLRVEL